MYTRSRLQDLLPKLVLAPSFVIVIVFVAMLFYAAGVYALARRPH